MTVDVVICGHSHVHALGVPFGERDDAGARPPRLTELVPPRENFLGLAYAGPRSEEYWDAVRSSASGRIVAVCWEGNQHHFELMFAPEPPLDFLCASRPDLPVDVRATLVPETMMVAYFEEWTGGLRDVLRTLCALPDASAIVLGTPPPRGDNERALAYINQEVYFVNQLKARGIAPGDATLSPPALRLKAWIVIQDMMKSMADDLGCRFIEVPSTVMDAQGFLRSDLWGGDATHANLEYGQLMLDHIERTLRRS